MESMSNPESRGQVQQSMPKQSVQTSNNESQLTKHNSTADVILSAWLDSGTNVDKSFQPSSSETTPQTSSPTSAKQSTRYNWTQLQPTYHKHDFTWLQKLQLSYPIQLVFSLIVLALDMMYYWQRILIIQQFGIHRVTTLQWVFLGLEFVGSFWVHLSQTEMLSRPPVADRQLVQFSDEQYEQDDFSESENSSPKGTDNNISRNDQPKQPSPDTQVTKFGAKVSKSSYTKFSYWRYLRGQQMSIKYVEGYPLVDVYIPVCKEPLDMVRDTIMATLALEYPQSRFTVYVLDDGGDDGLKDIVFNLKAVDGWNIEYIRRVKTPGVPHHAKAGNLNHALSITKGEFITVFDADQIAVRTYLREIIPYMVEDPKIGVFTVPQTFYNTPVNDPLWQGLYNYAYYQQELRDGRGCTPSIGTGVTYRRAALIDNGGGEPLFTHGTVEDYPTSMTLFTLGWTGRYRTQILQYGLAPNDMPSFIKQRQRWCMGNMEIFFRFDPLWNPCSGLAIHKRLVFICGALSYVVPFFTVANFLMVSYSMFDDPYVVPVQLQDTPIFLLIIAIRILSPWVYNLSQNTGVDKRIRLVGRLRGPQYFFWEPIYQLKAIIQYFAPFKVEFRTSNAARTGYKSKIRKYLANFQCIWFHVAVVVFSLSGVIYRYAVYFNDFSCLDQFVVGVNTIVILWLVQQMSVPIVYLLLYSKEQREPDRRMHLTYDEIGAPVVNEDQFFRYVGKNQWMVLIFDFVTLSLVAIFCATAGLIWYGWEPLSCFEEEAFKFGFGENKWGSN